MENFKNWLEATDIFGFAEKDVKEPSSLDILEKPIRTFNVELMMDFLSNKRIGLITSESRFLNEMQWGGIPGSVKLKIDTGCTFYVKKMIPDLQGTNRWITKKMLQLNRQGYGGFEDAVAGEIYDQLEHAFEQPLDSPSPDFEDLENLVQYITRKVKRVAKHILVFERVKKIDDDCYYIIFNVRGAGNEAPDHRRVNENVTQVSYDRESGTIRVINYNVESPVGGTNSWQLGQVDLDLYFMPTQDFEEIAECVGVHYKYY